MSRFVPRYRLFEMMDWFSPPPLPEFESLLADRLDELVAAARVNGWDLSAEDVYIEGPVELISGQLMVRIPLDAGGARLAPLAKGIGEVIDGCLQVVIQPWFAEMLNVSAGSLVVVDNLNGKFTITRSAANDE